MKYLQEQDEWDRIVKMMAGPEASLVNVSVFSSDCRIYKSATAIYKIRRITPASYRHRLNSLEDEFLILRQLTTISGIPRARDYQRHENWEVLEMDPLPELRVYDPTFGPPQESLRDFLAVARIILKINYRGCSHGDLHTSNAGRNIAGTLSIFDFDQAQSAHPLKCLLRDVLGFAPDGANSKISLWDRAAHVQYIHIFTRPFKLVRKALMAVARRRRARHDGAAAESPFIARVALQRDPQLHALAKAWELAARSQASSPGVNLAYYSLDVSGINFPGERPWLLRWHHLKANVDFRGKRVLELGCNLGLLSIHAKLSGASECLAVDLDPDIIAASQLAAQGFGVHIQSQQLDLNVIDHWLEAPEHYDIVCALSVMHWIKRQQELWAFLGRFRELIYEGHEGEAESIQALKDAGFTQIKRLGSTERNRPLFLACATPASRVSSKGTVELA